MVVLRTTKVVRALKEIVRICFIDAQCYFTSRSRCHMSSDAERASRRFAA